MATTTYETLMQLAAHHPTAALKWQVLDLEDEVVAPGYPVFEVENGLLHARLDDVDQATALLLWCTASHTQEPCWAWVFDGEVALGQREQWLLTSEDLPAPPPSIPQGKSFCTPRYV